MQIRPKKSMARNFELFLKLPNFLSKTERPSAPLKGSDQPGYGAIAPPRPAAPPQAHVPNNPFVSGALYQAEPVQPPAHDYYDGTQEQPYNE